MADRLRQAPGEEARRELTPTPRGPPPSRWTLRGIRATFDWLAGYTLGGVWRWLDRCGLGLRTARVEQFSPDPEYDRKVRRLGKRLRAVAADPKRVVAVFLDEMGYTRWPDPGPDWGPRPPADPPRAERFDSPNRLWRVIGAMNAWTGRVDTIDGDIVGRAKVLAMYERWDPVYPTAERIDVTQDNWSIHTHEDVLGQLPRWPRVTPVWLPTYAPWLNPIEKLWRWLRQQVLRRHRLAGDWEALRTRVNDFFAQFAHASNALLGYVGLLGRGKLARWLHPKRATDVGRRN